MSEDTQTPRNSQMAAWPDDPMVCLGPDLEQMAVVGAVGWHKVCCSEESFQDRKAQVRDRGCHKGRGAASGTWLEDGRDCLDRATALGLVVVSDCKGRLDRQRGCARLSAGRTHEDLQESC